MLPNRSSFHSYVAQCFRTQFTSYAPEWVSLAMELLDLEGELIAADIEAKHPAAAGMSLDERIATFIEGDDTLLGGYFHRVAHALYRRDPAHRALPYFARLIKGRSGMEIHPSTVIGPRLVIMHGEGIVIGPDNFIGSDCIIYQGAALGSGRSARGQKNIVTGERCTFFADAKVIGPVTIGHDVNLAANAVLSTDAESNATYAGVPAIKITQRRPSSVS